jgi:carbonic anhydrase
MIDQIIDYNKDFVARKGYEKYLTDKYPRKTKGLAPVS